MKKKIIVAGGGFAGVEAAAKLEKDFNVTLIDRKDYFDCNIGAIRAMTNPDYVSKMTVPYHKLLTHTEIIQGELVKVTPVEVSLSRRKIPFDYLLLCTGSSYRSPIKAADEKQTAERIETFINYHHLIKESQSILVTGGGPVGVEVAAQIACMYPGKKVTVIEAGPHLLTRLPERAQSFAESFLTDHGATLILNERLEAQEKGTYVTNKGTKIEADLELSCLGVRPNTSYLAKSMPDQLDEYGYIKVDPYLNLSGLKNIFALGDCSNIHEEKLALNAKKQATSVIENIHRLEKGKPLKPYKISKLVTFLIGCGESDAIMSTPWATLTGHTPGRLKKMEVPMLMKTVTKSFPQVLWSMY